MTDFIVKLGQRPLLFGIVSTVFIAFESMFMFPINYSRTGTYNVILLMLCILIGVMQAAIFRSAFIKVLLITTIACMAGFACRVWLEWGEYTMGTELTIFNVLITYVPVIVVLMVSYVATLGSKQYMKAIMIEFSKECKKECKF